MAALSIRGLDEGVKRRLPSRAASHGQSMEAEARAILTRSGLPRIGTPTVPAWSARRGYAGGLCSATKRHTATTGSALGPEFRRCGGIG
jgi:plasmid stability protein